jgi:hypothetical protein
MDRLEDNTRRIEYVTLAELVTRLHPRNPKQHDIGAIIESYRNHGFVASGVLDDRTGLFLAGHGRIEALNMMRKQGMEAPRGIQNGGDDWLVPVQVGYESENDSAAMAYLAADNKLTELGGWNEPLLAELLQEVHNSGEIALEATGYDADGLDELLRDLAEDISWNPPLSDDAQKVRDVIEFGLSSFWKDLPRNNECSKYFLPLLKNEHMTSDPHNTVKGQYSRANATETERIIKTYMRPGDVFYEPCCGWMTFSSSAKYFGFSGKGSDIWDKSIAFCERQLKAMKGDGVVSVEYGDCRDIKEPSGIYDFVYCNPPFFHLEEYGSSNDDLAATGSYELWLEAMGITAGEIERILKPGSIVTFVINDFRENKKLISMHSDFANSIISNTALTLHDIVVAEVISQSQRMWRTHYNVRRTAKCHEYIITFKKPERIDDE